MLRKNVLRFLRNKFALKLDLAHQELLATKSSVKVLSNKKPGAILVFYCLLG
jgi:hypothetical protein